MNKTEGTDNSKPLILIAEDNISNYLLFETLLKHNYRLIHAINGKKAVSLFMEHQPQLILMDIKMPEMDGYEATREIRKVSSSVPIIAVTAYAFPEDQERILSGDFNGYLSKPVDFSKLRESIHKFL